MTTIDTIIYNNGYNREWCLVDRRGTPQRVGKFLSAINSYGQPICIFTMSAFLKSDIINPAFFHFVEYNPAIPTTYFILVKSQFILTQVHDITYIYSTKNIKPCWTLTNNFDLGYYLGPNGNNAMFTHLEIDPTHAVNWRYQIEYCPPGSRATAPPPESAPIVPFAANRAAANRAAANRAAANRAAANRAAANRAAANRAAANRAAANRAAAERVAAAIERAERAAANRLAAERAAIPTVPSTPDQILERFKTTHKDAFIYTGPSSLKHRWCYQVLYSERFLGDCMNIDHFSDRTEYYLKENAEKEIKIFKYKFENNKPIIKYATLCPYTYEPMTREEYDQLMRFHGGGRSIHGGESRPIMHRELVEDDAKHLLILKPIPCPPELNDGYFSGVRNALFKKKRTRKQRNSRRSTRKNR